MCHDEATLQSLQQCYKCAINVLCALWFDMCTVWFVASLT